MNIRVLHLTIEPAHAEPIVGVRLQRYLQSNINMGIKPIVLCRDGIQKERKREAEISHLWIPNHDKISFQAYNQSRLMAYFLPPVYDEVGLDKIFKKCRCDLVHAHSPETAYYSYKRGLPTLFDDCEYWLEYLDYRHAIRPEPTGVKVQNLIKKTKLYRSYLSHYVRIRKIVTELIRNVQLIVTNEEVERRYRELGASSIFSVPNVPLKYEREYAFAVEKKKKDTITTCYIGNMTADENDFLRNTKGIRELWDSKKLGSLYIFEGKNYVPHLEVLRKVRECHFNLLFWKPLRAHRFYLQNKAFLASVVGVPTIISSSLKATVNLLGDFALKVNSLNEIPEVIRGYDYSKEYSLNPAHLWEYYEPRIKAAYEDVLLRSRK